MVVCIGLSPKRLLLTSSHLYEGYTFNINNEFLTQATVDRSWSRVLIIQLFGKLFTFKCFSYLMEFSGCGVLSTTALTLLSLLRYFYLRWREQKAYMAAATTVGGDVQDPNKQKKDAREDFHKKHGLHLPVVNYITLGNMWSHISCIGSFFRLSVNNCNHWEREELHQLKSSQG